MMSRGAERTCFIYTWPTVGLGELLAGLVAEAVGKPFMLGLKRPLCMGCGVGGGGDGSMAEMVEKIKYKTEGILFFCL